MKFSSNKLEETLHNDDAPDEEEKKEVEMTEIPEPKKVGEVGSVPTSSRSAKGDGKEANGAKNGVGQDQEDSGERKKRKKRPGKLPKFPLWPDAWLTEDHVEKRQAALERYLKKMLMLEPYRNHHETAEFLEVSKFSFIHNLGIKTKEGIVKKRPGGRRVYGGVKRCCNEHCAKWSKRWLIAKDSFIAYIDPDSELVRSVLLYDTNFSVAAGAAATEGVKHGLLISNLARELMVKCESDRRTDEWKQAIEGIIESERAQNWVKPHRFGSSFPVRENSFGQWFTDGRTFMDHAASMMELAREEIYITDWWLSPEVYMKRPVIGDQWRLDVLLKRKAEEGVKIFILLYKEVEMALGMNSLYSKKVLQCHPNIRVMRHPDHVPGINTVLLWAHHEKIIIVDQNIAFVGGIDLCYGRWDDHRHKLDDMGSVKFHTQQSAGPTNLLGGMRQFAQMIPAFTPATITEETGITSPQEDGRDEVDDGSVKVTLAADPTVDEADTADELTPLKPIQVSPKPPRTATQESNVSNQTTASSTSPLTQAKRRNEKADVTRASLKSGGFKNLVNKARVQRSQSEASGHRPNLSAESSSAQPRMARLLSAAGTEGPTDFASLVAMYKDYVDSGEAAAEKLRGDTPPPERKRRNKIKRMVGRWREQRKTAKKDRAKTDEEEYEEGWMKLQKMNLEKDEADVVGGKLWIGKDYVNFIFKDFTDLDMPFHDFIDRGATPRMPWHDIHSVCYGAAARDVGRHFIQRWNACKEEKLKEDENYPFLLPKSYENVQIPRVFRGISHPVHCQVLRSACEWSTGMGMTEDSIQQAYLSMIANSQHYVYIENQFFVSMIDSNEVHNEIAKTLLDRIVRADENKENFRVYVMLPLMPAFEGQIGATGGSALQAVLYWTYQSISCGPHSLLENLSKKVSDPSKYIVFCGLRKWAELGPKIVTELLYIHSKLIIVDDRQVLIGSANINDRSMLGKRDSEMALFFEDNEFVDTMMGGKPYKAGKFASSLRKHLFNEHLGLLESATPGQEAADKPFDITDCNTDEFYRQIWLRTASKNTDIFEKVFRVLPTDEVLTFEALAGYQAQIPLAGYNDQAARDLLKKVQGSLVLFPTRFLANSNLAPSYTTKEGLAPTSLFT